MYNQSADLYDLIHNFKDYEAETVYIQQLIRTHQRIRCQSLLDAGCGTGKHLHYLQDHFEVRGLELDSGLLEIARQRLPRIIIYHDDMRSFSIGRMFDVITCLFGTIAYTQTIAGLRSTFTGFARHLNSGGMLILEPFLQPQDANPGKIYSFFRDEPYLKVARFSRSTVEDNLMTADYHYLVGSETGITYLTETHLLGLFTINLITEELKRAGFTSIQSPSADLFPRGILIAIRS